MWHCDHTPGIIPPERMYTDARLQPPPLLFFLLPPVQTLSALEHPITWGGVGDWGVGMLRLLRDVTPQLS